MLEDLIKNSFELDFDIFKSTTLNSQYQINRNRLLYPEFNRDRFEDYKNLVSSFVYSLEDCFLKVDQERKVYIIYLVTSAIQSASN